MTESSTHSWTLFAGSSSSLANLTLAPPPAPPLTLLSCRGTSWLPVVGCEHVQKPLLACDLTSALSDPHQTYLANITALLDGWMPGFTILEGIEPIRDS